MCVYIYIYVYYVSFVGCKIIVGLGLAKIK